MFRKILVANRGEIACRIMRTCRRMGTGTVAVYSDADAGALHRHAADEAVHIGPAPARDSYLDIGRVLDAARRTGADAVHPGYGFLSENPGFAEACAAAGLAFIGPPPAAMRAMSGKADAKRTAEAAGVPVLPGASGDDDALLAAADKMGWPVLVKAVAGGGGRGMRRADGPGAFAKALAAARREAAASFGDDRLMVERCIDRPRHLEVQLFADAHGDVVHLHDRDCSLQRRHQKLVEEAPAPGLPDAMRTGMAQAAVQLARAIGYRGAGTVEFIADVSAGLRPDRVWFLEMNTRLQVEHTVTEAVTGLDLVEWQLRIAAGEPLPLTQDEIRCSGHAVEARLCAEDPARADLPSPGVLRAFHLPSDGVRVDTGVHAGDTVTPFYDSLLAKVVAHGATRAEALDRLGAALARTRIEGVASNARFLQAAIAHEAFRAGDVDTGFLPRHRAALLGAAAEAA